MRASGRMFISGSPGGSGEAARMCLTYLDYGPKLVNGCAHCLGQPPSGVTKGFAGALTLAKPAKKRGAEGVGLEPTGAGAKSSIRQTCSLLPCPPGARLPVSSLKDSVGRALRFLRPLATVDASQKLTYLTWFLLLHPLFA